MNHLISYSDAIHPLYFLTRFVEGLRQDIRVVVMVQRPKDLDTACALAILQEVADGQRGGGASTIIPKEYPPQLVCGRLHHFHYHLHLHQQEHQLYHQQQMIITQLK